MSATAIARGVVRLGPRLALRTAHEQLLYSRRFLGLRCDLESAPAPPAAKIPVAMIPAAPPTGVFDTELISARGEDWRETYLRHRMVVAEVAELFVARDAEGAPIYAQWLVRSEHWARLERFAPGRYPQLGLDEALVEGAFTFPRFRGFGAMADGMAQLLAIARDAGSRSVLTYVGDTNIPSLRGCARVGFDLDHVRVNRRRLGRRSSTASPPDEGARRAWEAATAR